MRSSRSQTAPSSALTCREPPMKTFVMARMSSQHESPRPAEPSRRPRGGRAFSSRPRSLRLLRDSGGPDACRASGARPQLRPQLGPAPFPSAPRMPAVTARRPWARAARARLDGNLDAFGGPPLTAGKLPSRAWVPRATRFVGSRLSFLLSCSLPLPPSWSRPCPLSRVPRVSRLSCASPLEVNAESIGPPLSGRDATIGFNGGRFR
jgi:hypothetical protein